MSKTKDSPKTVEGAQAFRWSDLTRAVLLFLRRKERRYLTWVAIIFLVYFYFLVPPYLMGSLVNAFTNYSSGDSLNFLYSAIVILGCSSALTSLLRLRSKQILAGIGIDAAYNARVTGFDRLMEQSLEWHGRENTGNKVQRIQAGSVALKDMMGVFYENLLPVFAAFVGVFSSFLLMRWQYALFCACYLVVYGALLVFFYRRIEGANLKFNASREQAVGTFVEGMGNVLAVQSLGAEQSVRAIVNRDEEAARQHNLHVRDLWTQQWQVFQILYATALAIFVYLIGVGVVGKEISLGMILVYFAYYQRLSDATTEGATLFYRVVELKTQIARMMPIFAATSRRDIGNAVFPAIWRQVAIHNGTFRYNSSGNIFTIRNLNIEIPVQGRVGIAGGSGSGKSTIARLLVGLYPLESGTIKVDSTNLSDISRDEIAKHISIVLQESELFNISLRENITLMRDVPSELLERAIRIAALEVVIAKLPVGLDTPIGERGYHLSGGERQRIGIARAICRSPQLLILDEATSSLDAETELRIQQALEAELPNTALLVIAHRLTTLRGMERIYVVEQGEVIEQGNFEKLMADADSKFARLYRLQKE